MPVKPKESSGQVLRGVCPQCGQTTKGRDHAGRWISRCAHPGEKYQGRMMQGGKKTIPVIPDSVDLGDTSGVGGALDARPDIDPRHGVVVPLERAQAPLRGLVDANEPRDDERPQGPVGAPGDPLSVDPRGALESIAKNARALAGALAGAQRRIRELEGITADQAIDLLGMRGEFEALQSDLDDAHNEISRLRGVVAELEGHEPPDGPDDEGSELDQDELPFDPDDVSF